MKKIFSVLISLFILFTLCACGCRIHGHSWADATCETQKTCTVCGETEGEALGHSWVDANYQSPKTCSLCGAAEGEALTADFEAHGLRVNTIDIGTGYSYITSCYKDPEATTVGQLEFNYYKIFDGDETHPALKGYEWHYVSGSLRFSDENAWNYGVSYGYLVDNYYDVEGMDNSQVDLGDGTMQFTVNFNGVDYPECLFNIGGENVFPKSWWENGLFTVIFELYFRVPVGYDGMVFGFRDYGIERGEDQRIYDIADRNTLLFRLNGYNAYRVTG